MSQNNGILYIVATPIGNLHDLSFRAVEILKTVDLIAAEDTRHSRHLLDHYDIDNILRSLHEYNERKKSEVMIGRLLKGESIAIISDAGTPLISDPGFTLVRLAQQAGIKIVPIPGACALIAALSASGLATNHFIFKGFPPRNRSARKTLFQKLRDTQSTIIFYESSHRISDCLVDLQAVFPPKREIVIAKELTKVHETIVRSTVTDIHKLFQTDPFMSKGEFVILIEAASAPDTSHQISREQERILRILLNQCSLKQAVLLTSEITGLRKKVLYQRALEVEHQGKDGNE